MTPPASEHFNGKTSHARSMAGRARLAQGIARAEAPFAWKVVRNEERGTRLDWTVQPTSHIAFAPTRTFLHSCPLPTPGPVIRRRHPSPCVAIASYA